MTHASDDDPRMSMGHCLKHGDYNGRNLRCPQCREASLDRAWEDLGNTLREMGEEEPE